MYDVCAAILRDSVKFIMQPSLFVIGMLKASDKKLKREASANTVRHELQADTHACAQSMLYLKSRTLCSLLSRLLGAASRRAAVINRGIVLLTFNKTRPHTLWLRETTSRAVLSSALRIYAKNY